MKIQNTLGIHFMMLLFFCFNNDPYRQMKINNIEIGNQFINVFYSFDSDSLQSILSSAIHSQPEILYYQKWAECANYKVMDRSHYFEKNDSLVIFPVTVKDDLMDALAIDFNVTDTFHLFIQKGKIISVTTSSNDTDTYYQAKEWVRKNRPELIEKPCEGIWAGGPTPCECVLGMIKGFKEFTQAQKHTK